MAKSAAAPHPVVPRTVPVGLAAPTHGSWGGHWGCPSGIQLLLCAEPTPLKEAKGSYSPVFTEPHRNSSHTVNPLHDLRLLQPQRTSAWDHTDPASGHFTAGPVSPHITRVKRASLCEATKFVIQP